MCEHHLEAVALDGLLFGEADDGLVFDEENAGGASIRGDNGSHRGVQMAAPHGIE
jgi:hypothetical protein